MNALTFRYSIRIGNNNDDFLTIKRQLANALIEQGQANSPGTRGVDGEYDSGNIVYQTIFNRFEKVFRLSGNLRAYLSNYSERRGSLLISFTVVLIGVITNYGSIRESADYFAEDIERIFATSLSRNNSNYKVSSDVQDPRVLGQPQDTRENVAIAALNRKVLIGYALSFVSLLIALAFAAQNFLAANDSLTEDKVLRLISSEIRSQRIDNYLKGRPDTVYVYKRFF